MASLENNVTAGSLNPRRITLSGLWYALRRWPVFPVGILAIVVIAAIGAPWIAPHNPERGVIRDRLLPPFWASETIANKLVVARVEMEDRGRLITLTDALELDPSASLGGSVDVVIRPGGSTKYLLGTDQVGRDMFSRLIYGARISLIVGLVTLAVGGSVGVALGLIAGLYGGWVDELIMRLVDVLLSLPVVLVALVFVVALGQSFAIIVAVLALWIWTRFARQVRSEVLQLKTRDYVALARVSGASTPRILLIHIFPGTINTLIVVATLQVGIVILLESVLSFLGAGVPPPTPAWGSMVSDGRDKLAEFWWISTLPGIAILLTVMSLNLLGDWLRDKLDPRLRQLE